MKIFRRAVVSIMLLLMIVPAQAFKVGFFKTKDNLSLRMVHLPAKGKSKGSLIFLEGMGGYIEGYTGIMSMLSESGYHVYAYDARGQGASQRITMKDSLLHVESFDDYIRDLDYFIHHHNKLEHPIVLLGISMGGHVALRYAYEHPGAVDALILMSPMVEINTGYYPSPLARTIVSVMNGLGAGESFVLGYDSFDFKSCLEKYDSKKFGDLKKHIQDCKTFYERPHLAVGGPSFSWLRSAFDSCDKLKVDDLPSKLSVPIMMISVENDHLVDTDAQLELCKKLPYCRQYFYNGPDAHHNLLKDADDIVARVFDDIKSYVHILPEQLDLIKAQATPQTQLVMHER